MSTSTFTEFNLPRNAYAAFDAVSLKQLITNRIKFYTKNIDSFKKKEAIMTIGHHMDRHSFVMDVEINAFVCMVTLSKILHA